MSISGITPEWWREYVDGAVAAMTARQRLYDLNHPEEAAARYTEYERIFCRDPYAYTTVADLLGE